MHFCLCTGVLIDIFRCIFRLNIRFYSRHIQTEKKRYWIKCSLIEAWCAYTNVEQARQIDQTEELLFRDGGGGGGGNGIKVYLFLRTVTLCVNHNQFNVADFKNQSKNWSILSFFLPVAHFFYSLFLWIKKIFFCHSVCLLLLQAWKKCTHKVHCTEFYCNQVGFFISFDRILLVWFAHQIRWSFCMFN